MTARAHAIPVEERENVHALITAVRMMRNARDIQAHVTDLRVWLIRVKLGVEKFWDTFKGTWE